MGLLTNISLFSGAGGLDLGAKLVGGFRTIAYCEWEPYAQGVLKSRIADGGLDDAPIWDDVSTFDGRPFFGLVDVVSGGFPCQDLSLAARATGHEREGIGGGRSGLWKQYARIVGEVRPRFVLVENVPGLLADGALGVVLGDLADLGYDAQWERLSAAAVGAPHTRERIWVVAYPSGLGLAGQGAAGSDGEALRANGGRSVWGQSYKGDLLDWVKTQLTRPDYGGYGEPPLIRVVDGMAFPMERIKLCGNGVVPIQSSPAWQKIKDLAGG